MDVAVADMAERIGTDAGQDVESSLDALVDEGPRIRLVVGADDQRGGGDSIPCSLRMRGRMWQSR